MVGDGGAAERRGQQSQLPEEFDSLREMARKNLELEARYGGDLWCGRERPLTW